MIAGAGHALRVLFVTPEALPFVKTGGLGDVSHALPAALRRLGIDVRLLLPGYPAVLDGLAGGRRITPELMLGEAPGGAPVYALDRPALYARPGNPYLGPDGKDWPDNHLRFGALCRAAAPLDDPDWQPDIVHGNDWQSGLIPAYWAFRPGPRPATILTVHNLAFQGLFPAATLGELGLPPESFAIDGVEYWGQVGFMKAGLFYADRITTVSPTYAREIQLPALGFGLDGLLRARSEILTGILNGVEEEVWNPATDPYLAVRYDAATLDRKAANKRALQQELGLDPAPDPPLFVAVSRLTEQKGLDLVLEAVPSLIERGGQLALLGAGDASLEAGFRAAAAAAPRSVAIRLGYDEALSHRLQGGGDSILVPSRFEPCGLTQMYGLRYGTLPLVRRTGGLADTVSDGETGFVFEPPTVAGLAEALDRALDRWRDGAGWRSMQHRAMAQDVSWNASARRYAALYAGLMGTSRPL